MSEQLPETDSARAVREAVCRHGKDFAIAAHRVFIKALVPVRVLPFRPDTGKRSVAAEGFLWYNGYPECPAADRRRARKSDNGCTYMRHTDGG